VTLIRMRWYFEKESRPQFGRGPIPDTSFSGHTATRFAMVDSRDEKPAQKEANAPIATLTLNPTIDVGADVEQVVADEKLRCSRPRFEPGGGGINVSRAIAKLGGESIALWTRGGPTGEHLVRLLAREDLSSRPIPIDDLTREHLIIYEQVGDRQFRFCMPGPRLTDSEVESCLRSIAELDPAPRFLVLSGSLPENVGDAAAVMTPGIELCRGEDAYRLFGSMQDEHEFF